MPTSSAPQRSSVRSICMLVTNDMLNDPRVARHAATLGRAGFSVSVICPKSERSIEVENRPEYSILRTQNRLAEYLGLLARVRKSSSGVLTNEDRLITSRRKNIGWLMRAILTLLRIGLVQFSLLRKARSLHADVYCANDLDTLLIAILTAGLDRKVVYDSHELWPDMIIGAPESYKALLRSAERILIKRADAVMTVNEFIADELANRYKLDQSPYVVYNCPAPTTPSADTRPKQRSKKVALYQGRYAPERGLENLVRAAEYLLPDVELVMRGYGNIEGALKELASGRMNVRFEEPVAMEEMLDAAREADVGIVSYLPTNLCNYLASPNKLFEYIHAGLAVVASDMPFMRKVILENHIGTVFDPTKPTSIASALNEATRDEMLERYRKNLPTVARQYSWTLEFEKLLQVYKKIMERPSPSESQVI